MLRAAPASCWPAGWSRRPRRRCGSGPGTRPRRYERAPFAPEHLGDPDMGLAADLLAEKAGVSRERQDALRRPVARAGGRHPRRRRVRRRGRRDDGVTRDERPRAGLTPARLARLRPAFRAADDGTVTAGNRAVSTTVPPPWCSSTPRPTAASTSRTAVLATATAGVDPRSPASASCRPSRQALAAAGIGLDDSTRSSSTRRSRVSCWPAATRWRWTGVQGERVAAGQQLTRERLVELDHVEVVQADAGDGERPLDGRDQAEAGERGVEPRRWRWRAPAAGQRRRCVAASTSTRRRRRR